MKRSRFTLIGIPLAFVLAGGVFAKLPPPSEEAQAKKAEAAAKAEWSGKVAAYETCQAQMRLADRYFAEMKHAGKEVQASQPTPACVDPGPYASATPDRPVEASGAHSPASSPAVTPNSTPSSGTKQ